MLRVCRDNDVVGLDRLLSDPQRPWADEPSVALEHGRAFYGRGRNGVRYEPDHVLLAIDKLAPVELRPADLNAVFRRLLDFVERMSGGRQDLLGRALSVRAGPAKFAFLDERNGLAGFLQYCGSAKSGVAAADYGDVEFWVIGPLL